MRVRTKVLLSVLAGCSVVIVVALVLLKHAETRVANVYDPQHKFRNLTPLELEREVRDDLPLGTSQTEVQAVLRQRGFEYSCEAQSHECRAVARYLKGSNALVFTSLGFDFRFDNANTLSVLTAKTTNTGL